MIDWKRRLWSIQAMPQQLVSPVMGLIPIFTPTNKIKQFCPLVPESLP
jgi:hypothetical protein